MCDMCSSPEAVYKIELEGSMLNVCEKCASYGRIVTKLKKQEPEPKKKKKQKQQEQYQEGVPALKKKKQTETVQIIVPDYPVLIKKKREKLGLRQEELAKKIAEKESIIHKLESGRMKPGLPLARKLEKFLKIKIVDEVELDDSGIRVGRRGEKGSDLTIGDLINIK